MLSNKKIDEEIETKNIYIDGSYTNNYSNFPLLSTDDKRDFKIKINGGDLIAFKSPSLTTVDVSKMKLKESLNNILEDLNANRKDFTNHLDKKNRVKKNLKSWKIYWLNRFARKRTHSRKNLNELKINS